MKKLMLCFAYAALLTACSAAPKARQPSGDWTPVNKPVSVRE